MSFLDDSILTIGQGLAKTAINDASKATGLNVGGIMNTLFGNGQANGGAALAGALSDLPSNFKGPNDQLKLLEQGIKNDTALLQQLGSQLASISSALGQISGQIRGIEKLLEDIHQKQLFVSWNDVDSLIDQYRSATRAAYQTYADYMASADTTHADLVAGLVESILHTDANGPKVAVQFIHDQIVKAGRGESVLQLWSDMVVPLITKGVIDFREGVDQYIEYYQRLAYVQLQATNLLMEAYNYSDDSIQANKAWSHYRSVLLNQENNFIRGLLPLIGAGLTFVHWSFPGKQSFGYGPNCAAMQINPELQLLPSGPSYFEPSPMLRRAEEVLAQLYVTEADQRRMVVHMSYSAMEPIQSLVLPIKLSLLAADGTVFAPTSTATVGSFFMGANNPYIDYNLPFGVQTTRLVYEGTADTLADGSYTIQDINGQDNLVPQRSYASAQPVPFLGDGILATQLYIGGVAQFDFTNLVAYSFPCPFAPLQ